MPVPKKQVTTIKANPSTAAYDNFVASPKADDVVAKAAATPAPVVEAPVKKVSAPVTPKRTASSKSARTRKSS